MEKIGKIRIKERPFEELLRSAFETLNVECIGCLFGEKYEKRNKLSWIIENVHPIQIAYRFPRTVECSANISERGGWSVIDKHLGDYHTHPTTRIQIDGIKIMDLGRVCMSTLDRNDLKENPETIEVIVALRKLKVKRKLKENPFLISGYIDDKNNSDRIDVGGYYYNHRVRRTMMDVPRRILRRID